MLLPPPLIPSGPHGWSLCPVDPGHWWDWRQAGAGMGKEAGDSSTLTQSWLPRLDSGPKKAKIRFVHPSSSTCFPDCQRQDGCFPGNGLYTGGITGRAAGSSGRNSAELLEQISISFISSSTGLNPASPVRHASFASSRPLPCFPSSLRATCTWFSRLSVTPSLQSPVDSSSSVFEVCAIYLQSPSPSLLFPKLRPLPSLPF